MKLHEICILKTPVNLYSEVTYVILIDEEFKGPQIDTIDEKYIRLATEFEIKEYQVRFKEYCDRNNNA